MEVSPVPSASISQRSLRTVRRPRSLGGWTKIPTMLLLLGSVLLWAPRAGADSTRVRQARKLFRQAESAYRLGAYNQALEKFQGALELARRPSILLNIAQCHRHLGHADKALRFYRQYLSEWERFRPGIEAPYRTEVEGHIAKLTEQRREHGGAVVVGSAAGSGSEPGGPESIARAVEPAKLRLEGVLAGAEVTINGELTQRAQGGAIRLRLEPGEHLLVVSLSGYEPWQKELVLEPGENAHYLVPMTEAKPAGSTAWLVTGICTTTLAVAAEALAIVSTVLANDSFKGSKKFNSYKAMAITGHVLAGAFLVTSGISWYLYYRSTRQRPEQPRAAFGVVPRAGGFAAAVRLRF